MLNCTIFHHPWCLPFIARFLHSFPPATRSMNFTCPQTEGGGAAAHPPSMRPQPRPLASALTTRNPPKKPTKKPGSATSHGSFLIGASDACVVGAPGMRKLRKGSPILTKADRTETRLHNTSHVLRICQFCYWNFQVVKPWLHTPLCSYSSCFGLVPKPEVTQQSVRATLASILAHMPFCLSPRDPLFSFSAFCLMLKIASPGRAVASPVESPSPAHSLLVSNAHGPPESEDL